MWRALVINQTRHTWGTRHIPFGSSSSGNNKTNPHSIWTLELPHLVPKHKMIWEHNNNSGPIAMHASWSEAWPKYRLYQLVRKMISIWQKIHRVNPPWPSHRLVHKCATQIGDSTLQRKTTQISLEGTQQHQFAPGSKWYFTKDHESRIA